MKAAIYLRVSSKGGRQDEANQEPVCRQLCDARGWTPVIYRERESAVKVRPEWERLIEDARCGLVRAVVFYSIHRIGRRRVQIAADVAELLRFGQAVVSVREKFLDVDSSPELAKMRDLLVQWWGWFAETEREEMIDKTNLGLARVKADLAATGKHTSKRGRVVTRLGRPNAAPASVRTAVRLLASSGNSVARILAAMKARGHDLKRSTVRGWIA